MSFLWIPKSIRHRTEYSFSMKMWNCRLNASQTDDAHTVAGQIASRPHGPATMGARAPFSTAASHFLNLASEERRQLSKQAVIPRTEPYNSDGSTLADFPLLIAVSLHQITSVWPTRTKLHRGTPIPFGSPTIQQLSTGGSKKQAT